MKGDDTKLQEGLPNASEESSRRTRVGFPQTAEKKPGPGKLIFVILAIVALLAVGGWLLLGDRDEEEAAGEPTPTTTSVRSSPTPALTKTEVNRKGVKIQVLNGTGITGAAGSLKDELAKLGYSEITAGNASSQSYKNAEVTYSEDVDSEIKEEITDKLEDLYQDVDVKEGKTSDFDVKIFTGYPKGHTPTPTEKPAATATPKPTISVTTTVTPTTTPTP